MTPENEQLALVVDSPMQDSAQTIVPERSPDAPVHVLPAPSPSWNPSALLLLTHKQLVQLQPPVVAEPTLCQAMRRQLMAFADVVTYANNRVIVGRMMKLHGTSIAVFSMSSRRKSCGLIRCCQQVGTFIQMSPSFLSGGKTKVAPLLRLPLVSCAIITGLL